MTKDEIVESVGSEAKIDALARYFTGPMVAHHSMGLSMSEPHQMAARAFFEAREAVGIRGYDRFDVARAILKGSRP